MIGFVCGQGSLMSSSPINRRRFVSLSTASVGSVALSSSLAFALSPVEARRLMARPIMKPVKT
jgi:hypothetical protein